MTETAADPPDIGRFRSGVRSKAHGFFRNPLPARTSTTPAATSTQQPSSSSASLNQLAQHKSDSNGSYRSDSIPTVGIAPAGTASTTASTLVPTSLSKDDLVAHHGVGYADKLPQPLGRGVTISPVASTGTGTGTGLGAAGGTPPAAAAASGPGPLVSGLPGDDEEKPAPVGKLGALVSETLHTIKIIMLHSWINWLLLFVPAGIIVKVVPGVHPGIVFAMNCIAIIPLAGLLSHATETVARKMGDAIGALLNVTFGNAVELIIL